VFLGPLDYIGSGGGGETLPGVVTKKNGPASGKTFVVPLKYLAGGDLDGTVAVSAAGQYQFGSYPADECSVPFTVTAPPGTRTVIYNPFSAAGLGPGVHVTARASGTCLQDPSPAELICPTDPASGEVVRLTATSVVPGPGTRPSGPGQRPRPATNLAPWAIELADGQVCLLVEAAWGGLGPYSCKDGLPSGEGPGSDHPRTRVADCHLPDSSQPRWTARCQLKETVTSAFSLVNLGTVWF
jgi:hypothetical protein